MRRRNRSVSQFSLSFLDVMSCGLGAVILLFMIIHHATRVRATEIHREVASKVSTLESEVLERRRAVESLAAAVEETRRELEAAEALAANLEASVAADVPVAESDDARNRVASLQEEVRSLERQIGRLREREGDATRTFAGEGDRQYLTGLRVGGRHVLILVDTSASMLGETIVDVLRRRNLPEARRGAAPKWRRALDTVDWITTQIPPEARFQLYAFDVEARPVLTGTDGRWLETDAGERLTAAVEALRRVVPANGTSLHRAFLAAARLSPRPDNIYLLTDGLPTQGRSSAARGTVSGDQRLRFYRDAVRELPPGVPVNVILFPMEGDPLAAGAFWRLAQVSGGSFLSPSRDWP
jgi:hypothetical protein